jgi:hypothetical protein
MQNAISVLAIGAIFRRYAPVCLTSVVLCFYFVLLRLVCPVSVLPVSLEFPILIAPSCIL